MKIEDIASLEDTEAAPAKREAEMQEASFVGVMRDDAAELVAPSEFDALVPVDVERVVGEGSSGRQAERRCRQGGYGSEFFHDALPNGLGRRRWDSDPGCLN